VGVSLTPSPAWTVEEPPREATLDPVRCYATLAFVRGALVSLAVALGAGILGAFYYTPVGGPLLRRLGIDFTALRPIHTTFASAWIFLGGIAVVHRYLQDQAGPVGAAEKGRLLLQVSLWAAAGTGILLSLGGGVYSGREYMGFHPALSIPLFVGWLCFAWNFFRATGRGFLRRPVYVTMWGVSILFFLYTFAEQHAWLIPGVYVEPVRDLRLQWKACGTLVGSFNLLVYGSLYYIGEKLSGDESYAHSRLAYALFGVGLLNSFTNFAHHTYHIPQSLAVKWISFVISMTEILILARVVWDVVGMVCRRNRVPFRSLDYFVVAAKWWTLAVLFTAILISIPPVNTLIHGTHAVTAHAMGSEIGIDSMVLFAAVSLLLAERPRPKRRGDTNGRLVLDSRRMRIGAVGFNLAAAFLVLWLTLSGSIVGYHRYLYRPTPEWLHDANPWLFAAGGVTAAVFLTLLLAVWIRSAFARTPLRSGRS